MPTYEYRCQKCQKTFDAVQSMKDERFTVCPEALCQMEGGWGKGEVTRLLGTGAGLIFKGSGFYITDYRSDNYKQSAKQEAGGGEKKAAAADSGSGSGASGGDKAKSAPAPASTSPAAGGSGASPAPKASGSSAASSASPKKD